MLVIAKRLVEKAEHDYADAKRRIERHNELVFKINSGEDVYIPMERDLDLY